MDDVAVQHVFEAVVDALPERLELLAVVPGVLVQPWRRRVAIADVRHEDRVVGAFDRSRNRRPDAGELPEGLPLARDPEAALDLAAELRLLVERGADPPLLDELAVAVQPLVAEVPLVKGW